MANGKKPSLSNKKDTSVSVKLFRTYKYPTGVLSRTDRHHDALHKARVDFLEETAKVANGSIHIDQFVRAEIIEKTFERKEEHVTARREIALRGREYINSFIDLIARNETVERFGELNPESNPDAFEKRYTDTIEDEAGDDIPDEDGPFDYVLSDVVESFLLGRVRFYTRQASLIDHMVV